MDREQEAQRLVAEAEKKMKPGFFTKLMSSSESRYEEALDLYEKAGNMYKLTKKWYEAGECFEKCGSLEEKLKSDAAGHYQDAAHCFNFVDKKRASDNLQHCMKIYENQGRFQMAGKIQKQMAEEHEADLKYDEAAQYYKKAAEYFSMENTNSKSYEQGCLIKQADLMCLVDLKETLEEATKIYEKIGMQYLTVPLLKSGAKDLFFKCCIVFLAYNDHISAENFLNKFLYEDPSFSDLRESNFLKDAIQAFKEKNVNNFKAAVTKLKNYSDIDKWRIHMFTKIMQNIENVGNEDEPYL